MDQQAIIENIPPPAENTSEAKTHRQFTTKDVSRHSSYDSCWIFIGNFVYDVTEYLSIHPGGWEIILEFAGSDATLGFLGKGHSSAAISALSKYCIGQLSTDDRLYTDCHEVSYEEPPKTETAMTMTAI